MWIAFLSAGVALFGSAGAYFIARRTGQEFREDTLYACVAIVVTYIIFNEYRRARGPRSGKT